MPSVRILLCITAGVHSRFARFARSPCRAPRMRVRVSTPRTEVASVCLPRRGSPAFYRSAFERETRAMDSRLRTRVRQMDSPSEPREGKMKKESEREKCGGDEMDIRI